MKSKFSYFLYIGLLLISMESIGQELKADKFKEISTDISAREHEVLDVNDEPCALVKIYTGISNLNVTGNRGVEKIQQQSGVLWVWVPQDTRQLKISKDGLPMLPYYFPYGLKSSTVYSFELTSDQLITITIATPGIDASVVINGKTFKTNGSIPNIEEGKYGMKIYVLGHKSITDSITVTDNNKYFTYKMEREEQAKMTVTFTPKKSDLFINHEHIGNENHTGFYYPGDNHIKIIKNGYVTIDTSVAFTPQTNSEFTFHLVKDIAWIKFENIDSDAEITIDNERVRSKLHEISANSDHSLVITKNKYRTITDTISVSLNDTLEKIIKFERQEGEMALKISPKDIEVNLDHKGSEDLTWNGDKKIKLPIGEYTLTANKKGFEPLDSTFFVKDFDQINLNLRMKIKNISPIKAGMFSLIPGAGQFYSQRNTAGVLYLATTLALAGASTYYYFETNFYANDYKLAKLAYDNAVNVNEFATLRENVTTTHDKYMEVAKARDYLIYATAGVYIVNIIDAIVFSKYHEKSAKNNLDIGIIPVPAGAGLSLSYTF